MRVNTIGMAIAAVLGSIGALGSSSLQYDEIRDVVMDSLTSRGNDWDSVKGAASMRGLSSNEFSRILVDVASDACGRTNVLPYVRQSLIEYVAGLGTTNATQFLTGQFRSGTPSDATVAFIGLCRLDGISDSMITNLQQLVGATEASSGLQMVSLYQIIPQIDAQYHLSTGDKSKITDFLHSRASVESRYPTYLDRALQAMDSTYATSRRRLQSLRAVLPNIRVAGERGYVKREIAGLEALPELND